VIYVKSERSGGELVESVITAEYEVTSAVFEDNERIFQPPYNLPSETFSQRIRLRPLKLLGKPIEFKPLVSQLSFIKNKKRWSYNIRGRAVVKVPDVDYLFIKSKIEKVA